jgi:pyroglutamyl-peptidase
MNAPAASHPKILVTGFEPFAGADDNPSSRLVERLNERPIAIADIHAAVLPVSVQRMPAELTELLRRHRPDVVLGLGEARGSAVIRVERVAVNLLEFAVPDNDGVSRTDTPVVPGGPPAYFTSIPANGLVDAIRAASVPCTASLSAGSYLCNQMFYLTLHWAAHVARQPRVAFLHLPSLPTQNTSGAGTAAMDLDTLARGVRAALLHIPAIPCKMSTPQ